MQDHQELQRVTTRTKEPPPPYSPSWEGVGTSYNSKSITFIFWVSSYLFHRELPHTHHFLPGFEVRLSKLICFLLIQLTARGEPAVLVAIHKLGKFVRVQYLK